MVCTVHFVNILSISFIVAEIQAYPHEPLDCSNNARKKRRRRKRSDDTADLYAGNKLDNILNPQKSQKKQTNIDQTRKVYRQSFANMNMTTAYPSMFELLWYSQLPCFDVKKYTSARKDHRSVSLLKCSKVFVDLTMQLFTDPC